VNDPADLDLVSAQTPVAAKPLAVTVDIFDTATTGTDRGSGSNVSLRCCRNDPANPRNQNVTGQEDGSVSLGAGASLIDNDTRADRRGCRSRGYRRFHLRPPPAVNVGGGGACGHRSLLTLIPPADQRTVDLTLSAFTWTRG
jgi:hypothetical protein